MRYKSSILTLIFIISAGLLSGQSFSEKKVIHKSLPVNKDMTLELDNKYGTIHITPWTKDSVAVRAEVEAFASNLDRLHKMFHGIDVNISETSFMVRVQTEFTQNISMLFESFKGMTNKLIPYESRIQINYYISAPEYLSMKITNKYGDVYMENSTGKFSLNLSNGSFKANNLGETGGIDLTFCDATINKMGSGYLDASFSEIEIGESRDLTISAISSRFDIRKSNKISVESRRDKFYIGSVASVSGNSYFSDFRIDELQKEINLVTKYGSLNADLIEKGFDLVTINSGYTDISLAFDPAASYNLDIRHTNTFLVIPEKNSATERKTLNQEKDEYMTFGTVGRNPGNTKVMIDATRGNIYLK